MAFRTVRLGEPRHGGEGLRIGTVRRPPRGVRKTDYAARDYYDAWLPELAPSAQLVGWYQREEPTPERWARFSREYRREMSAPGQQHLIKLLAELSKSASFSVGCYCRDETHCHRSLLRELLLQNDARSTEGAEDAPQGGP